MTEQAPSGWRRARIQDLGEVLAGRQRSPNQMGTPRPYLRVANVLDGTIDTSDVLEMPFTDREYERFRLLPGDVLVNEGQSRDLVGRSAVYRGDPEDCCFQNTIIRFRAGSDTDAEFAHQLFAWLQHRGRFSEIATQTTSIAHLGVNRFAQFLVHVPGVQEQRQIAATLKTVDDAIAAADAVVEQLGRVRSSLVERLLEHGPRSRGEGAAAWRRGTLVEYLRESIRNGYSPVCPKEPNGRWTLSLSAVTPEGFNPAGKKPAPLDDPKVEASRLAPGDVVVSRANGARERVGLAGIYRGEPADCSYPDLMMRVRTSGDLLPEFLELQLLSVKGRRYFFESARGTATMLKINREMLEMFPVVVPPLDEQKRIVGVVAAVVERISKERAVVAERRRAKAALADALLSGRMLVRDAA